MGTPDPLSRRLELHNTWLVRQNFKLRIIFADSKKAYGLKHYVDWAVKQGYGVIDVNLPKRLPGVEVKLCEMFGFKVFANSLTRLAVAI